MTNLNGQLLQEGGNFVSYRDANGNIVISLNKDGTIALTGVTFLNNLAGTPTPQISGAIPIVSASDSQIVSTAPTVLSSMLPATTLYQLTFYYGPSDTTGSGSWSPTVDYTDPAGNTLNLAPPYLGPATAGDVTNFQSYSIPFFCKGGTAITITGAYTGTPFPMNIALRIVAMP